MGYQISLGARILFRAGLPGQPRVDRNQHAITGRQRKRCRTPTNSLLAAWTTLQSPNVAIRQHTASQNMKNVPAGRDCQQQRNPSAKRARPCAVFLLKRPPIIVRSSAGKISRSRNRKLTHRRARVNSGSVTDRTPFEEENYCSTGRQYGSRNRKPRPRQMILFDLADVPFGEQVS